MKFHRKLTLHRAEKEVPLPLWMKSWTICVFWRYVQMVSTKRSVQLLLLKFAKRSYLFKYFHARTLTMSCNQILTSILGYWLDINLLSRRLVEIIAISTNFCNFSLIRKVILRIYWNVILSARLRQIVAWRKKAVNFLIQN